MNIEQIVMAVSAVVLTGFVAGCMMFGSSDSAELSVNLEAVDSSSNSEFNQTAVVSTDGNAVVVNGTITGRNGGMEPVLNEVTRKEDEVHVDVGLEEKDGAATTVITEYSYRVELVGVRDGETVVVMHDGEEVTRATV